MCKVKYCTDLTHQVGEAKTHHHSGKTTSNKPFPSLLRAKLDQRSSAHEEAKHVGHDIINDDHHDGKDEPDETLEHVLDDEIRLSDHTQKSHMGPGKQRKLPQIIFLHQRENKPNKP